MREILFRGKRRDNGEWIVGQLIRYEDGRARIVESGENIFCYEMDISIIQTVAHHVIPENVGQYTGLCDENGNNVFEGDIIQIRFEGDAEPPSTPPVWYETGKVIWCEQRHGWYVVFDNPDGIAIQEYEDGYGVFVTGNIHDNPELLEVSNE